MKQALIIGLGQFGFSLAQTLVERGVEVIAIDTREEVVQAASELVTQALCLDATNEQALASIAPARRDLCVCAIGSDSREAAILVTALLRQMGARRIITRASDKLLERILLLVGAHEVVNPERAFGQRLATRLLYDGIVEEVPLGSDLVLTELRAPTHFIGRTLRDLELPRRFGLTVVAIRRKVQGESQVDQPAADYVLGEDDLLIIVAKPGAVQSMTQRF